jgi:hypothetical protein
MYMYPAHKELNIPLGIGSGLRGLSSIPCWRSSENMALPRSYWSGKPLGLDRGHTNFREPPQSEVRRTVTPRTGVYRSYW